MRTQYFDLWRIKHAVHDRRAAVLGSPIPYVGGWLVQVPARFRHGCNLTHSNAFA